jgi:trimeric autotransporter adhesin
MKKLLLIFHVCIGAILFAQSPQKMSYQAVIRNAADILVVNTNLGMKTTILQGSATGTEVYEEIYNPNPKTNANGLVTLEIGGGIPTKGTFQSINWANGPFFIKTSTDIAGGTNYTLVGTAQLLSVPYALFSANGTPGPKGDKGDPGAQGAAGTGGVQGPAGIQGIAGPQGPIGLTGATGATGPAGTYTAGSGITITGSNISAVDNSITNEIQSLSLNGNQLNISNGNSVILPISAPGWSLKGNAGTNELTDFIGSTDNKPFNIRVYNRNSGHIDTSDITQNTNFGYLAGSGNVKNTWNTAFGFKALSTLQSYDNTSGNGNTAIGNSALARNTWGSSNTAVGSRALLLNVGSGSLSTIRGCRNTAIGADALYHNNSENNTAIGYQALFNNTNSENTAIGTSALYFNEVGSHNTAIGNDALKNNFNGYRNTAIGDACLYNSVFGIDNIGIGSGALSNIIEGNRNIGIGGNVPRDGYDQVRIGSTLVTYAGIQVPWTITSDRNWKTDINKSDLGLKFIRSINPVVYRRKNDESKKLEYGFIAQEVEIALKEAGIKNNGIISVGDDGMYGLRYNDLIPVLTKAIQEQQAIIDTQNQKIDALIKRIEILEKK